MSAMQSNTNCGFTVQLTLRSAWKSLALFCLLALGAASSAFAQATADLAVSQVAAPSPVGAGTNITYTITVTNAGPDLAAAVTLTDTIPAQVAYVSSSTGCTELGGVVTCDLGGLAGSGSATVTIVVSTTCSSVGQVT